MTDANGCRLPSGLIVISQPASAVSVSATASNSQCPGSTGSSQSFPAGGVAPYSFLWSNGATTQNIANVPAGTYSVSVRDSSNCGPAVASAVVGCDSDLQIVCPPNVNLQCPANFSPNSTGVPAVSGCPNALEPTFTDSFTPACGNTGTTTRTWSVSGCNQVQTCTQLLIEFDTIKPAISALVPGGLDNVTVACLSDVASVPVSGVSATDNCQDPNTYVPCNCCNLCSQTDLFPCCGCERPRKIQFVLTPTSCSTSGNADEDCTESVDFPIDAPLYQVTLSDYFSGDVYFSGSLSSGGAVPIERNTSFVRIHYRIVVGVDGVQQVQEGSVIVACKSFRRGETYGSLQVVGMFPGQTCDTVKPCACCSQCGAITSTKRTSTAPKCLGRRCGLSTLPGGRNDCCAGASCHLAAGGYKCRMARPSCLGAMCTKDSACCDGASCRFGAGGLRCRSTRFRDAHLFAREEKVSISYEALPIANGEIRVYTANDLCDNVQTASQYVIASNTACKREL